MPNKIFNYNLNKTVCNCKSTKNERNDYIQFILELTVNNI